MVMRRTNPRLFREFNNIFNFWSGRMVAQHRTTLGVRIVNWCKRSQNERSSLCHCTNIRNCSWWWLLWMRIRSCKDEKLCTEEKNFKRLQPEEEKNLLLANEIAPTCMIRCPTFGWLAINPVWLEILIVWIASQFPLVQSGVKKHRSQSRIEEGPFYCGPGFSFRPPQKPCAQHHYFTIRTQTHTFIVRLELNFWFTQQKYTKSVLGMEQGWYVGTSRGIKKSSTKFAHNWRFWYWEKRHQEISQRENDFIWFYWSNTSLPETTRNTSMRATTFFSLRESPHSVFSVILSRLEIKLWYLLDGIAQHILFVRNLPWERYEENVKRLLKA